MKNLYSQTDHDYEGNRGCILLIISFIASVSAVTVAALVAIAVNELINLVP
jgi:hypothetical protein